MLLVDLPPLQDLPNHVATAHIIAHPELYPEYVFHGFFRSNALLMLWLRLFGAAGLFGAARAFTALVLGVNAIALPCFLLRLGGRRGLLAGTLFTWPLVHGFFVSMGMLNFAFGCGLALLLVVVLDRQRERPTRGRTVGLAVLAGALWYAHPFPLAVVAALAGWHTVRLPTWRARGHACLTLVAPLGPAALLAGASAWQHVVKSQGATDVGAMAVSFQPPWETVGRFWLDSSGALTRWGSMTVVPAVLLPWFAWKGRRLDRPFFSRSAVVILIGAYFALPVMWSNWWYFNARLAPFLWAGLAARLPLRLPRPVPAVLAICALAFSIVLGVDYVRLDRDRARFTAGLDAVPARATLLPLLFEKHRPGYFTASLTHAWAFYMVAKDTSAPLVFAVERSYPITYRVFPPRALIPPALDELAELHATPARMCQHEPDKSGAEQPPGQEFAGAPCEMAWRRLWSAFWREAEPRFSHLLTWAIPPAARRMIPDGYHRVFSAGELEIYARGAPSVDPARYSVPVGLDRSTGLR